jgi:hypothetical protein
MSAAPEPGNAGASRQFAIGDVTALLQRHGIRAPERTEPTVSVDAAGAKGDGVTDDTAAIQAALDSLKGGGTLLFTPGKTYLKSDLLIVNYADVKLWGYGAVLYSVVSDTHLDGLGQAHVALHLAAPRSAVYGLSLVSNMRGRAVGHPHLSGVWLSSQGQAVMDSHFEYTNILVRHAQDFVLARNVVYRSTADGIHVTTGSGRGKILGNVVRETGDDMIAVVNYGLGEPTVGNVLIEGNDVSSQYWGRGIAVVGGKDIVIRGNRIARTPFGAGILIHSETSYETSNVRNVLVEDNRITDVQTLKPAYNPARRWKKTGHGAIDVYGQGDQEVSQVRIVNNSIEDTDRDGIFVRGNSCDVDIVANQARGIGGNVVRIDVAPRADCRLSCRGNSASGRATFDPRCVAGAVSP